MDLRTFVSDSILEIVAGIGDAQARLSELNTNARINPALVNEGAKGQHAQPTPVEFDVALTVTDVRTSAETTDERQRSGMISVVSAEQASSKATDAASGSRQEAFSRVRFSIMVAQPAHIETYRNTIATSGSSRRNFAGYP